MSELSWTLGLSGFPGTVVKNLPANTGDARDASWIPGWGRFPGGGHGNPFQYSCLENFTDSAACRATVHAVTKSQTRLRTHTLGFSAIIWELLVDMEKPLELGPLHLWPLCCLLFTFAKQYFNSYQNEDISTFQATYRIQEILRCNSILRPFVAFGL